MTRKLGPPIDATRTISAPTDAVWAVIAKPGHLERCHPFCVRNPVEEWPGPDSRDEIHYLSGWIYERHFVDWFDGIGYDLEIGGRGEPRSRVEWRISPIDKSTSRLTITVRPHLLGGAPAVLRSLSYAVYVRPMLRRYLSSVVRGVDWFVTRGQPVTHDQFGRHPWFSARRQTGT